VNFPLACFANSEGVKRLVTSFVAQADRWSLSIRQPVIAPFHQGKSVWIGIEAARGQPIFVAAGPCLISLLLEEAIFYQKDKPVGERIAGNIQVSLEIVETTYSKKKPLAEPESSKDRQQPSARGPVATLAISHFWLGNCPQTSLVIA